MAHGDERGARRRGAAREGDRPDRGRRPTALRALGAHVDARADGFVDPRRADAARAAAASTPRGDHRVAMLGAVAGLASREGVEIGARRRSRYFPGFLRPPRTPRGATMIVAIDGPAGAGKSTVARMLAERLGFRYLDTGRDVPRAHVAGDAARAATSATATGSASSPASIRSSSTRRARLHRRRRGDDVDPDGADRQDGARGRTSCGRARGHARAAAAAGRARGTP